MAQILFTKNSFLLSRMIRGLTKEPVSHCAVRVGSWVIHSTIFGPEIRTHKSFIENSEVVFCTEIDVSEEKIAELITRLDHRAYDYPALIYLALRYIFRWLPKANLWNTSGMYLCTELVTEMIYGKADSMITPYGLYKKIQSKS